MRSSLSGFLDLLGEQLIPVPICGRHIPTVKTPTNDLLASAA
jgi:hypothetical protein